MHTFLDRLKTCAACALAFGLLALPALPVVADTGAGELPWTGDRSRLRQGDQVPEWRSAHVDVAQLMLQDEANLADPEIPWRVGFPMDVDLSPANSGAWEDLPGGGRLWRLRVATEDALWIVLGFDEFGIQEGGRMSVYDSTGGTMMGPYTASDVRGHGELWFPPLAGDELTVELYWPETLLNVKPAIHLGTVSHGYRPWGVVGREEAQFRAFGDSGSCNIDTTCTEAADWQDEKRGAVMVLSGGSGNCSGALINTTAGDCRTYLLTAAHCGENGPSTTIGFNYECPTCGCTTDPGTITAQTLTGGTLLASFASSDFTLIEMDDPPPEEFGAFFVGWSRDPNPAQATWVISYPRGDVRKIAFDSDPPVNGQNWGPNHWRIDDSNPDPAHLAYEWGTTEPASSGSPLMDQNHRIIGQLHGGTASCSSDTYDEYGKIDASWVGGGTPATRLADWLDPLAGDPVAAGAMFVDGIDHSICLFQPAGTILLDRARYGCSDTMTISLRDDNIPGDPPTFDVIISSATEVNAETLTLTQLQPGVGRYAATFPTGTVPAVNGDGLLSVTDGDGITVNYIDADDGAGGTNLTVKDTAVVDCQSPAIVSVTVSQVNPRSAVVTVDLDEEAQAAVPFGTVCGSPDDTATSSGLQVQHDVLLQGLLDETTYYFTVEATDEAGNSAGDDNGGACFTFTTPEVPDSFTEQFTGGIDLADATATFTPSGTNDFYSLCTETAVGALPTDPAGGTDLGLGDDQPASFTLTGGATVDLYGQSHDTVWVGPNGYLTFGAGDSTYNETLADHFDTPRVAALFDDLNPSVGGSVSWKQLSDRVAVMWDAVPEYSTSNSNTFQIEMFFDGRIRITWLQIDVGDAIAGLSAGLGLDPEFLPSDLSNGSGCGPRPPRVSDPAVQTEVDVPVGIVLAASDDGLPEPASLSFSIRRLPAYGTLTDDATASPILVVPHVLSGGGSAVTYTPVPGMQGWDSFDYSANDGGSAPEGGESGLGTVGVTIGGLQVTHEFLTDDTDPGWSTTGDWAFGVPTGGGSNSGDPTGGATGANVYGYSLTGDYPNSMGLESLTSTPVDLSGVVGTVLDFQRWLGVESSTYDHATLQISTDGSNWTTVWDHSGSSFSESAWSLQSYDISGVADGQSSVSFRWVMGTTDGSVTFPGWNIDDVRVWGLTPAPCSGPPAEVPNLGFSLDTQTLDWDRASYAGGGLPIYDVLRSDAPSDFGAGALCLESDDGNDTSATDADEPAPGAAFYYLVRPENDCGAGSLGPGRAGRDCTP